MTCEDCRNASSGTCWRHRVIVASEPQNDTIDVAPRELRQGDRLIAQHGVFTGPLEGTVATARREGWGYRAETAAGSYWFDHADTIEVRRDA